MKYSGLAEAPAHFAHAKPVSDPVRDVELPLRDLEFAIEQYLMETGCCLDLRTRAFLASVRDGIGHVALRAGEMSR